MSKKYSCPNCGAPIGYGDRCAYCGTHLEWEPICAKYVLDRPNIKKLISDIRVNEEHIRMGLVTEERIKRDLIEQMVEPLTECAVFYQDYDFITQSMRYKAILRVAKPRTNS